MNVVVTGANSLIGKRLVRRIVGSGDNSVVALVRNDDFLAEDFKGKENVIVLRCTMKDYGSLSLSLFPRYIDWMISLAWASGSDSMRSRNDLQFLSRKYSLELISRLLDAGRLNGLITSGSQAEYGNFHPHDNMGFMEEKRCFPLTSYGHEKLLFHEECQNLAYKRKLPYYHLRIFSVYGEEDREEKVVNKVAKACHMFEPVFMRTDCSQLWNLLYVEDLIDAIEAMLNHDLPCGTYNVGSGDNRRLCDYLKTIAIMAGKPTVCSFSAENNNNAHMADCRIEKILSTGKWYPKVTWESGVQRLLNYYGETHSCGG